MEDDSTRIIPVVAPSASTRQPEADRTIGSSATTAAPAGVDSAAANSGPQVAEPGDNDDLTLAAPAGKRAASGTGTGSAPASSNTLQTLPGHVKTDIPEIPQVGRYRILHRIGRGGMASVFRATDPEIGRDVAIKFLHASLCADEEYRPRFLQEARAAGGLSHPNIVVVHDVGEIDGRPYMAMELIDGESLSEVLAPKKPLPVRDVVIMGIQLARALDYAHSRGIVHRDIKPGNIMRLVDSQTIKVTDFGIAHVESVGTEQRTRVGDVLGTPEYMSPEQAAGTRLDGRSDLFSSGIVLYQMLTGQRPFQGESLVALAMKITHEAPLPIEKLRPDLPASLRRVVDRCLAKAPDRRFQTGRELSEALSRVLGELDEAELRKNAARGLPLRVKWAGMMALIVLIVMAVAGTLITQRQYAAMFNQVAGNGAALTRFIAAQNAAAALGEDWETVDISLQEIMKTGDFHSITVIDRGGIVRAANRPDLAGKPFKPPAGVALDTRAGGLTMTRYTDQGETVLGFDTPITFQGTQVGRVALGLPERPLAQVAQLSVTLMLVLVIITVLAVAAAMYFVANWFAKPIKLLGESMAEIAKGRFDHRISEQRNDEFGQLYSAFDHMAQALHDRSLGAGSGPATPTALPQAPVTSTPAAAAIAARTASAAPNAPTPTTASTASAATIASAASTATTETNTATDTATAQAATVVMQRATDRPPDQPPLPPGV